MPLQHLPLRLLECSNRTGVLSICVLPDFLPQSLNGRPYNIAHYTLFELPLCSVLGEDGVGRHELYIAHRPPPSTVRSGNAIGAGVGVDECGEEYASFPEVRSALTDGRVEVGPVPWVDARAHKGGTEGVLELKERRLWSR